MKDFPIKGLAVLAVLLLGSMPAIGSEQESVRVTAIIFEAAPWIVTVISDVRDDGSGGVQGTQTGGMVTSQFPEAVVHLKFGGPADFNSEAISAVIRKNFRFQCGSVLSEGLPAFMIGKDVFSVRDGTFLKIEQGSFSAGETPAPALNPIEFNLELLSRREETWVFEARCTLPMSEGSNPTDQQIVLLKEIIGIRAGEPVLLGFPYTNSNREKFVYWVALLLEK
jgi:hypothetical protein